MVNRFFYHSRRRSQQDSKFFAAAKYALSAASGLALGGFAVINAVSFADAINITAQNMPDMPAPKNKLDRALYPMDGVVAGIYEYSVNSTLPDGCSNFLASRFIENKWGADAAVAYSVLGLPGASVGSSFTGFTFGLVPAITGQAERNDTVCNSARRAPTAQP